MWPVVEEDWYTSPSRPLHGDDAVWLVSDVACWWYLLAVFWRYSL